MAQWRFVTVKGNDADGDAFEFRFNTIKLGPSLWAEAAKRAHELTSRRIETMSIIESYTDGWN